MSAAPTDPLRIGICCFPTIGGSGVIATEVGVELARRGHSVHFIASELPMRLAAHVGGAPGPDTGPATDGLGARVHFHPVQLRDYEVLQEGPYPLALASKIVEVTRAHRLDLVHAHYAVPHATSAYLARQVLRQSGERAPCLITTLHGTDITLVGSDPSYLPITRFSITESDHVTVPSAFLSEATRSRLGIGAATPIELIPNFVDTERYRPRPPPEPGELLAFLLRLAERASVTGSTRAGRPASAATERLLRLSSPSTTRPRLLVHNSNFRALKRVGDTIHGLARVLGSARCPEAQDTTLVLIGDGPERASVEALAERLGLGDRVLFLGPQLDFVDVLQHADVFLLPSESESFGLAALEAQSCGVPVIGSRTGGVPEVVKDGVTGLLHPVGDLAAIEAQLIRLLSDDALLATMRVAARARVLEHFRLGPAVDRYEAAYRLTIAANSRSG